MTTDEHGAAGTRRERKAAARIRVLDAAARAIREKGAEGVSVAAVMREARLTHGTFYAHFASKEALVAEALRHAADDYRTGLQDRMMEEADSDRRLERLAETYLSAEHADDPGSGCFIATLGPEMLRAEGALADAFGDRVEAGLSMIEDAIGDVGASDARSRAIASMATVVGGMILARAAGDAAGRDAVFDACRDALRARRDAR